MHKFKPRFILVYPLAVWLFMTARPTEGSLRLGLVIVILGEALRLWANGYVGHVKVNWTQRWRGDEKIGQLVTAGPYAYVRHPLYLGTFLLGLGFSVIAGNWWFGLTALTFFLVVYRRKMAQEERILFEEWGEVFQRYQDAVPQWLPVPTRYADRRGAWSWHGIAASRELKTLAWVVVLAILLYFREEISQEHELLRTKYTAKRALLLAIMVTLMVSDGVFELVRRWRKRQASPGALSSES